MRGCAKTRRRATYAATRQSDRAWGSHADKQAEARSKRRESAQRGNPSSLRSLHVWKCPDAKPGSQTKPRQESEDDRDFLAQLARFWRDTAYDVIRTSHIENLVPNFTHAKDRS